MRYFEGSELYRKLTDFEYWMGIVNPDPAYILWNEDYWEWIDDPCEGEEKHILFENLCEFMDRYFGSEILLEYMREKGIVHDSDLKVMDEYVFQLNKSRDEVIYDFFFYD